MSKAVEQKTKSMIVIAYENILKGKEVLFEKGISMLGYKLCEIEEEETTVSWSGMGINIKTRANPAAQPRRETANPAVKPPSLHHSPQETPQGNTSQFQHEELQYMALQAEYLETRNNMFLNKMYLMCLEIAARYIKKVASSRKICMEVNEFAHDAATYVTCRYIKDPEFKLNPMVPYVFLACKSAMSRDNTWNMRKVSYEDWMPEKLGVEA
jgi:hypothetical protein